MTDFPSTLLPPSNHQISQEPEPDPCERYLAITTTMVVTLRKVSGNHVHSVSNQSSVQAGVALQIVPPQHCLDNHMQTVSLRTE